MSNCYICNTELAGRNVTEEHIILNACGGRLTSKDLICVKCNSTLGERYDATLASQLLFLSNSFNVKRHRKTVPNIVATDIKTGIAYNIRPGGYPELKVPRIKIENSDKEVTINVNAKDKKQLEQVLSGLQRKYPQIDTAMLESKIKKESVYLNDSLRISSSVGGDDTFRAVCKAAINFYIHSGGERLFIQHLLGYIIGNDEVDCVFNYPSDMVMGLLTEHEIAHLIHLRGCPQTRLLYCYIEYFSAHCFLTILNDDYTGAALNKTYSHNVVTDLEESKDIPLLIDRDEIPASCELDDATVCKIRERLIRANSISSILQNKKHFDDLINSATNEFFRMYPEGAILTEEIRDSLVTSIMKRLIPYYLRHLQIPFPVQYSNDEQSTD
ncbi:HNH endonuclease [Aeromonas dhakensis]|uniref:HNH endonuclease n=1 Tax=Aeromonas dhakensis TaxID=196024 RepID=UPI0009E3A7BC|nr:HNH endonuclease [Aeromonas dhakensis]